MKRIRVLAFLCAILMVFSACARGGGSSGSSRDDKIRPAEERLSESDENSMRPTLRPSRLTKEMDAEELAEYSAPRVVRVDVDGGHGSGFFIDDQGTLVTNYHVIEGTKNIRVHFDDGAEYPVSSVVNFSPFYDIAILKVDISGNDYFELASDADQYRAGKTVYTRGYPKDLKYANFTSGQVSNPSEILGLIDCVTFNAAISSGNSGGPLMNAYGEVIAINTFSRVDAQNINFGVKISHMDKLGADKNFSLSQYNRWYDSEVGNSYAYCENGEFYYSYVNTYQAITGAECTASTNDMKTGKNGYATGYLCYWYEYDKTQADQYDVYLNSIGFEYVEGDVQRGSITSTYYDSFNGYKMMIEVDTVENIIYVTCPIRG